MRAPRVLPSGLLRADSTAVLLGNAASLVVGFASGVVAARALEPTGRGQFFLVQTLVSVLAVVGTLGVSQAVVTTRRPLASLTRSLVIPPVATGLVVAAVLMVVSLDMHPWLTTSGVLGGGALAAAGVVTSFSAGLAQRRHDMRVGFQLVRLMPPAFSLACLLALVAAGRSSVNDWILTVGTATLCASVLLFRPRGGRDSTQEIPDRAKESFWRMALASLLVATASQLLYRSDALAVAAFLPSRQAGLYAVALSLSLAVATLGQSGGMVAFARLRNAAVGADQLGAIHTGLKNAAMVTVGVGTVLALGARELLALFYGSEYAAALAPMLLLLVGSVSSALDHVVTHAGMALGIKRRILLNQGVAMAVSAGMLVLTIPSGSLVAVALVMPVVTTTSAVLGYLACRRAAQA